MLSHLFKYMFVLQLFYVAEELQLLVFDFLLPMINLLLFTTILVFFILRFK